MTLHIRTNRKRNRLAQLIGATSVCLFAATPLVATAQESDAPAERRLSPGDTLDAQGALDLNAAETEQSFSEPLPGEQDAGPAYTPQGGDLGDNAIRQGRSTRGYTQSAPTLYQDRFGRQFYMDGQGTRFYADQPQAIRPGNTAGNWQMNRGRVIRPLGNQYAGSQTAQSSRPMLGIGISDADKGVRIDAVQSNSVASDAGLRPGDVIVSVDGQELRSADQLKGMIDQKLAGQDLPMTVLRGGDSTQLTASFPEDSSGRQGDSYGVAKPPINDSGMQDLQRQVQTLQQQVDRLSEEVGIEPAERTQEDSRERDSRKSAERRDRADQQDRSEQKDGADQQDRSEQQSRTENAEQQDAPPEPGNNRADKEKAGNNQPSEGQNNAESPEAANKSDNQKSDESENSDS